MLRTMGFRLSLLLNAESLVDVHRDGRFPSRCILCFVDSMAIEIEAGIACYELYVISTKQELFKQVVIFFIIVIVRYTDASFVRIENLFMRGVRMCFMLRMSS